MISNPAERQHLIRITTFARAGALPVWPKSMWEADHTLAELFDNPPDAEVISVAEDEPGRVVTISFRDTQTGAPIKMTFRLDLGRGCWRAINRAMFVRIPANMRARLAVAPRLGPATLSADFLLMETGAGITAYPLTDQAVKAGTDGIGMAPVVASRELPAEVMFDHPEPLVRHFRLTPQSTDDHFREAAMKAIAAQNTEDAERMSVGDVVEYLRSGAIMAAGQDEIRAELYRIPDTDLRHTIFGKTLVAPELMEQMRTYFGIEDSEDADVADALNEHLCLIADDGELSPRRFEYVSSLREDEEFLPGPFALGPSAFWLQPQSGEAEMFLRLLIGPQGQDR